MNQSEKTQDPGCGGECAPESGSDFAKSMCGGGTDMAAMMEHCPCRGMLKKRYFVFGLLIVLTIGLVALATVTGSVLGTIAFLQVM